MEYLDCDKTLIAHLIQDLRNKNDTLQKENELLQKENELLQKEKIDLQKLT